LSEKWEQKIWSKNASRDFVFEFTRISCIFYEFPNIFVKLVFDRYMVLVGTGFSRSWFNPYTLAGDVASATWRMT